MAAASRPAHAVLDIEDRGPTLNAGGFAMRITNAGIIGNAFFDKGLSTDPSFEIHPGSGAEALNHAELWVGAVNAAGDRRVSGGPLLEWRPTLDPEDRVRSAHLGTPGTQRLVDDDGDGKVDEEVLNGRDDDGDGEIDEDLGLFSEHVLGADYVDDRPEAVQYIYEGGEPHVPFGLTVHQEAYAWSNPGYDGIAGLSFHITNHSSQTLQQVYIGLLADVDSRDRNDRRGHLDDKIEYHTYSTSVYEGNSRIYTGTVPAPPRGSPCFTTLSQTVPVLKDGVPGSKLPVVAVVPLRHTTDPLALIPPVRRYARAPGRVSFRTTIFSRSQIPGEGGLPTVDRERYEALAGAYPGAPTDVADDYVVLVSCGPFAKLDPGQSLDFDCALVATLDPDSLDLLLRNTAVLNHGFTANLIPDVIAQPPDDPDYWYYGDTGRTGHESCIAAPPGVTFVWDPHCPGKFGADAPPPDIPVTYTSGKCIWTDADCDGCTGINGNETRFNWIDPGELPEGPRVRVASGDHKVRIEWDNQAEVLFKAGLSGQRNARFIGYRVYKLADWRNRSSLLPPPKNWALLGAWGNDTLDSKHSLAAVTDSTLAPERILYEQKVYPPGRYAIEDPEVLNGFDYAYVVTAVTEIDRALPTITLKQRMESPFTPQFTDLVQAHAASRTDASSVWVVPNPFRGGETWDRPPVVGDQLTRHIDFMGLPRGPATIKVWTLAGDWVVTIQHDGTSGDGEQAWDLVSRNGQEVESGIYLFTVDSQFGHQIGRFVIIR